MANKNKLKVIQSLIFETLHNKSMVSFELSEEELIIIFNDNYAVKHVCSVLEPLSTMYINSYIDYSDEKQKIVCIVY
jgi:S-adenosylmethionine:tRNA-ribosyltransferase-isomerase (queuine synthetase)